MHARSALLGLAAAIMFSGAAAAQTTTRPNDPPGTDISGAYAAQRDGTPNNPPDTAIGRALDRATTPNR